MGLASPLLRRGAEMLQQHAGDEPQLKFKVPPGMAIALSITVILYFIAMFKVGDSIDGHWGIIDEYTDSLLYRSCAGNTRHR